MIIKITWPIKLKIKKKFIFLSFLLGVLSCKQQQTEIRSNAFAPKVFEAKGYIVSNDSIVLPKNIPVDERKLKRIPAGKPLIVQVNSNIHVAGVPKVVPAAKPGIIIPGTDTFLLPKKISVTGDTVRVDMPETFVAGDITYKIPNPSSFGSFGKLQGLKHNIVTCLLQDKLKNLWICTAGGVTKYDGHSFTNFTDRQGLIHNDVRSVLQDKSGNIWFGTLGAGVSKYDGHSFTNFAAKDGLVNNYVVSMVQDKAGNIWFGTWGGVTKYDGSSFTNFSQKEGLVNNFVQAVIEDRKGNIWFGTSGGVSRYDGKSFTSYTQYEGLGSSNVYSMLEDRSGNIWFGTIGGGVSVYNGSSFMTYTEHEGISDNEVNSILEDKEGNVWLGTHYGISMFDGRSFTNFTEKQGLSNDNIYCILQDNSDNLWFGTGGGGVIKYDPHSFTHFTENEGLTKNFVFSIYEDKSGSLWFGMWRGGVSEFDGNSIKTFTKQQGLPDNDVRSICRDRQGNYWFATYKGVAKYDGHSFIHFTEKEGLINNDVYSIFVDSSGNLWFGTVKGASRYDGRSFTNFSQRQGLTDDGVYCIRQGKSGNLLFGASGGVFIYDGHSFTHFTDREGVSNYDGICVLEDKAGNLWVGTERGAFKYDGQYIAQLSEKEGLINNAVVSMLQDNSGNIWFGTRFGLSKLSPEKSALFSERVRSNAIHEDDVFLRNYGYADNFLGIGCNQGSILQTKNSKIWVGTNGGLTTFDPSRESNDTIAPNIQITAIKIANENINWAKLNQTKDSSIVLNNGIRVSNFRFDQLSQWYNLPERLSLAYDNNYVSFDFIGITMHQPQRVKYQYQLEGLEKSMSALTTQTSASYGNLIPGNYVFKVRAMNSEGYWSNELTYTFTIRPPWWQTWWFRTLAVAAFLAFVFFTGRFLYIYQLRRQRVAMEKQLAVEYERQRISSDLHDEIGSTLSSINIYTSLAKKEGDKNLYLDSINENVSDVINKLDDLVWSINPHYDSLASVVSRITSYVEPLANAKNIQLSIINKLRETDAKLTAEMKSHLYLIAKELLNNAIKHSGCTTISVSFFKHNDFLQMIIKDDGTGFEKNVTHQLRNGLHNIAERVKTLKGTIDTTTEPGKGVRTTINIPLG